MNIQGSAQGRSEGSRFSSWKKIKIRVKLRDEVKDKGLAQMKSERPGFKLRGKVKDKGSAQGRS